MQKALDLGFTSIMYDGSVLPYEENLQNTKKAAAMAAKTGAGLEAELGSMGRRESGQSGAEPISDDTKIYTDPMQAGRFVEDSGIDALACSFGTTHGIYLSEPKLDFEVVRQVREATGGIPVVMHGGSGVTEEDFHRAIEKVRRAQGELFYVYGQSGWSGGSTMSGRCAGKGKAVLFYGCSHGGEKSHEGKCKRSDENVRGWEGIR